MELSQRFKHFLTLNESIKIDYCTAFTRKIFWITSRTIYNFVAALKNPSVRMSQFRTSGDRFEGSGLTLRF